MVVVASQKAVVAWACVVVSFADALLLLGRQLRLAQLLLLGVMVQAGASASAAAAVSAAAVSAAAVSAAAVSAAAVCGAGAAGSLGAAQRQPAALFAALWLPSFQVDPLDLVQDLSAAVVHALGLA
jgi:hypothetical protein